MKLGHIYGLKKLAEKLLDKGITNLIIANNMNEVVIQHADFSQDDFLKKLEEGVKRYQISSEGTGLSSLKSADYRAAIKALGLPNTLIMWLTRELKRTGNLPELRIRGGFYSSSPNLIAYLKREDSKIKRHGNFALVFEDYPIEGMYIVHGDEEGCRVYEASKADELFLQEDFRLVWPLYDKESLD